MKLGLESYWILKCRGENNVKKTIVCLKPLCYICVTRELRFVTFVTFCFLLLFGMLQIIVCIPIS